MFSMALWLDGVPAQALTGAAHGDSGSVEVPPLASGHPLDGVHHPAWSERLDLSGMDGSGNLYAGGDVTIAGGMSASRIALWNGSSWSGSSWRGEPSLFLPLLLRDYLTPLPEGAVGAAVAYLAAELGVPEVEVSVITVGAVEWRDSSLGCPEPGMAYLTVITPGYRIILEVAGLRYEVHTDETGRFVAACE